MKNQKKTENSTEPIEKVSTTESEGAIFHFKTNINCSGCVAEVSSALNALDGICEWEVDTNSLDKTLSVHSNGVTEQQLIDTVKNTGFSIEISKP